jgi:hypothetical protein
VADLKEEYEADTRFQLGYTMGSLGISGNEPHEPGQGPNGQDPNGPAQQK